MSPFPRRGKVAPAKRRSDGGRRRLQNGDRCLAQNGQVSIEVREVVMPELQGAEEITVGAWSKQRGEHVAEGETLMEAHTDKVNAEIPSPVTGKVEELLLEVGDPVTPGQPIARISPE
jgi:multidrug resistance efflux pump